jgi:hypothetical protein
MLHYYQSPEETMKITADITIQLDQDEASALFDLLEDCYNVATGKVECTSLLESEQKTLGELRNYLKFVAGG